MQGPAIDGDYSRRRSFYPLIRAHRRAMFARLLQWAAAIISEQYVDRCAQCVGWLFLVGALFLMFTLAGCGGRTARLSPLSPDATILAYGDSITFGTGASPETSYPAVLETLVARKVYSAGVPGEVSAAGLARLPSALERFQPKLLILCHGGNDLLRKLDDGQTVANLRAMIDLARKQGVEVLLIAVPKPGLFPSPPDFYARIAKEYGLPYEDAALKTILRDNELKSDLVHPNAKGYARLAQAVADLLKKSGAL